MIIHRRSRVPLLSFIGLSLLLCCSAFNTQSAGLQKEITVDLGDGVSFVMVRIEPGTFTMGSPSDEKDRREIENQHLIRINKPYYIGKFEVTQAIWERVMEAKITSPCAKINSCGLYWEPGDTMDITCNVRPSKFIDPRKPVDSVSWRQCKEFIARLNLIVKDGGFRLPTEAEWEYAARAGTKTAYYCGNDAERLDDFAWYKINSDKTTHPVGTKKPNLWGLYDMYGNVWEWCEDKFTNEPYPFSGKEEIIDFCNRGSDGGNASQVIRGGSFAFSSSFCRSAARSGADPWHSNSDIGLRLVKDEPRTDNRLPGIR